jgi:hypothetical protein
MCGVLSPISICADGGSNPTWEEVFEIDLNGPEDSIEFLIMDKARRGGGRGAAGQS